MKWGFAIRWLEDYGMLGVLLLLCALFSLLTWQQQVPNDRASAVALANKVAANHAGGSVFLAVRNTEEDRLFANAFTQAWQAKGGSVQATVAGSPSQARQALEALQQKAAPIDAIICNHATNDWLLWDTLPATLPGFARLPRYFPQAYMWPNFLKADNLTNIAQQIAVIAMVAVGMTLVITAGGIDLSVGSLIALAAVVSTRLIRDLAGAEAANVPSMVLCCAAACLATGLLGCASGGLVAWFRVPAFIVTLAQMLVASGLAYIIAQGQSVYEIPDGFVWLGRGETWLGIPNSVVLMAGLYLLAHLLMERTALGRWIYAVGGNAEAARLAGVPVERVTLFVYAASGMLAGLGGVVMASQLKSGSPTYGGMYELFAIAAVVVGGTSLSGGEGKVLGTLVGALIIAVIQNGMNLCDLEGYTQKVVLGLVILAAVLLDRLKRATLNASGRKSWPFLQRP